MKRRLRTLEKSRKKFDDGETKAETDEIKEIIKELETAKIENKRELMDMIEVKKEFEEM